MLLISILFVKIHAQKLDLDNLIELIETPNAKSEQFLKSKGFRIELDKPIKTDSNTGTTYLPKNKDWKTAKYYVLVDQCKGEKMVYYAFSSLKMYKAFLKELKDNDYQLELSDLEGGYSEVYYTNGIYKFSLAKGVAGVGQYLASIKQ